MEKKIYNAPYLKVVSVKNDIIATSDPTGINNTPGQGVPGGFAPGRVWWDDEY